LFSLEGINLSIMTTHHCVNCLLVEIKHLCKYINSCLLWLVGNKIVSLGGEHNVEKNVRHSVFNHSATTIYPVFLEQLIVPHKAKNVSSFYGL
jgi:hypothetical protein